jgi:hypothetical protein
MQSIQEAVDQQLKFCNILRAVDDDKLNVKKTNEKFPTFF